jgi:hypothetical protein
VGPLRDPQAADLNEDDAGGGPVSAFTDWPWTVPWNRRVAGVQRAQPKALDER